MQRNRLIYFAKCTTILSVVPIVILANSTGAQPRSTGAPGDQTCAQSGCHTGTTLNSTNGAVEITYNGGTSYVPGQRGRFTVRITDTQGRSRYGFQATARLGSNLERGQAGTFHAGSNEIVECEDGGQVPCRATAPVQFITHRLASQANTFEFEWTPPAENVGEVRVYVAGNAANGNGQNTGDRIYTSSITLTPAAGGGNRPSVTEGGVVDPWTRKSAVAPGTWVEIYGQNFASGSTDWSSAIVDGRLPTALNGVSVMIDNKPATISLVMAGQINALIPSDVGTGRVNLVVRNAAGESSPVAIQVQDIAPVVFAPIPVGDRFTALLVDNATGALYGATPGVRPAQPGDVVQLYALGLGPTNPALITDRVLPAPAAIQNAPTVRFGDVSAQVLGSALIAPGLYQINLRVPDVTGELPLTIEVGGRRSPSNTIITVQR